MSKTIQRPLACRNAHCGAMCSPADAEFIRNPNECYNYERRDDLYRQTELLDKIKKAREEIIATNDSTFAIIEILDKLIAESE